MSPKGLIVNFYSRIKKFNSYQLINLILKIIVIKYWKLEVRVVIIIVID